MITRESVSAQGGGSRVLRGVTRPPTDRGRETDAHRSVTPTGLTPEGAFAQTSLNTLLGGQSSKKVSIVD